MTLRCLIFVALLATAVTAELREDGMPKGYVPQNMRVDCHPEPRAEQDKCVKRGCNWDYPPGGIPNAPACYYPTTYPSYALLGNVGDSPLRLIATAPISPYGFDEPLLTVIGAHVGSEHTLAVQISAPTPTNAVDEKKRSNIDDLLNLPNVAEAMASKDQEDLAQKSDLLFQPVVSDSDSFSFKIVRKSTSRVLWDTSLAGSLQYTNQFIQIATYLATDMVYGFGEHNHDTYKRNFTQYSTWPMFARDTPPHPSDPKKNLYGVHNFYMSLEGDGHAHGVFFANTHAQEVEFGPAPHLTYRAIGGDLLMYFFDGPSPAEVIQQYHALIQADPVFPPYWGLGFQLCRYGYKNIEDVAATVQRMRDAGIPQDTQYIDIDYMDKRRDFTYDHKKFHGLPQFVDYLHQQTMRFIAIVDPAISVEYPPFAGDNPTFCGQAPRAFIQWPANTTIPHVNSKYNCSANTSILLGHVWPEKPAAFPDFGSDIGKFYWKTQMQIFKNLINFDGIWIDMNEPSNFDTNKKDKPGQPIPNLQCNATSRFENPPYKTWGIYQYQQGDEQLQMSDKTICMDAVQTIEKNAGKHYAYHNLYGWSESVATRAALDSLIGKRAPVISRSTFPTSGRYIGHWLGDNTADWVSMRSSIIGVFDMNMFGIPFVGADICGFLNDTTEELCLRWQQLGAFYTYSRNHNDINAKNQDPATWKSVAAAARQSNMFRYWHLPYIYELMAAANYDGGMVTRPMLFEFADDRNTYELDQQFMLGRALMIIPALYQGEQMVRGYVPKGSWYDITGMYGDIHGTGQELQYAGWQTFSSPWTSTATVLLRGGQVILRQAPELTTAMARKNPVELTISAEWKLPVPRNLTRIDTNADLFSHLRSSNDDAPMTEISAWARGGGFWDDGEALIEDWNKHEFYSFETVFGQTNDFASVFTNVKHTTHNVTVPPVEKLVVYGSYMKPDWFSFKIGSNKGEAPIMPNLFKSEYSAVNGQLTAFFDPPLVADQDDKFWYITWKKEVE